MAATTLTSSSSSSVSEDHRSERLEVLARHKQIPLGFMEDRRSVYWIDYIPPKPGPNGITEVIATHRVQDLAQHKPVHKDWKCDKLTPIWPVSSQTLEAQSSERIIHLSQHKRVHKDYQMPHSPYPMIPERSLQATPSNRIQMLGAPRKHEDKFEVYETEWGQYNKVSTAALKAVSTERIQRLAQAKGYHRDFKEERPILWHVDNSALNAIANLRLQQLARPRSRTMLNDDFEPCVISIAAKRAHCTPRIEELCVPIPRKCKTKKV